MIELKELSPCADVRSVRFRLSCAPEEVRSLETIMVLFLLYLIISRLMGH